MRWTSSGTLLAKEQIQGSKHHERDDRRGQYQREHQQHKADRPAFVAALNLALDRSLLGGASQRRPPMALHRYLTSKRPLDIRLALSHPHREDPQNGRLSLLGNSGLAFGPFVNLHETQVVLRDLARAL